MGHINTYGFFLVALMIIFATTKPFADAQLISGLLGLVPGGAVRPISQIPASVLNNILPGIISSVNIGGLLCCTATGNCPGAPLPGALVTVNCSSPLAGGSLSLLGEGITDINGVFNISVPNTLSSIPGILPIPCNITLQLDRALCPALDTVDGAVGTVTRILPAVIRLVSVQLNQLLQLILNFTLALNVGARA